LIASRERIFVDYEFKQTNILLKLASSLPLIGTPLAMLIQHTELFIAQYGFILGALRGAFVGVVLAIVMICVSEVVVAVFDVGRYYIALHYLEPVKAGMRADVIHEGEATELQKLRDIKSQRRPRKPAKGDQ
jgi:hypothetical protein